MREAPGRAQSAAAGVSRCVSYASTEGAKHFAESGIACQVG